MTFRRLTDVPKHTWDEKLVLLLLVLVDAAVTWASRGFFCTLGALWAYHLFWQLLERVP